METGWLPDTPADDNVLRQFVLNQAGVNEAYAARDRIRRTDDVALSDSDGPVVYVNQAVLLRPLTGADDAVLDEVEAFFEGPCTLLSVWPTPDLTARGWSLVGHPAWVVRGPFPSDIEIRPDVEVRVVEDEADLAVAERVVIDGYPMEGTGPGTLFPSRLLDGPLKIRLGLLDGEPVAAAIDHVDHGVNNLCLAATLPAGRRRGVWAALVQARLDDAPDLPAVAFTSDDSRPGFKRMGFLATMRFTMWAR